MMDGGLQGGKAAAGAEMFRAVDPSTGLNIAPDFAVSTDTDVAEACRLAEEAFDAFRELEPQKRAAFLLTIADNIEAIRDPLVARAHIETGLPEARLGGECSRTSGQLRLFARVLGEGRWAGVVMDSPLPERSPVPRPDLRQRRIPLGPVAVFGASNFPLAFSVAGGDTASALAAGCPVIVKAHPAHPGTSALAAESIRDAVRAHGLPQGVFSLLQGPSNELGAALVADPRIKAVGFTGSRKGGLALWRIANARDEPIPVYAEMSSVNPVILFPHALEARAEALGEAYTASLTLGSGQFCTNPGVVLAMAGPALDRFIASAAKALSTSGPQVMLTAAIHDAYQTGVDVRVGMAGVETVERGPALADGNRGRGAIFAVDGHTFLDNRQLAEELFGPASIIVRCADHQQIADIIRAMEGQLTVTLHLEEGDYPAASSLTPLLERKAGRLIVNGWPTGVDVSYAMVHGGPFPATSDSRSTSVGAAAIDRFLRPVCYQDIPEPLLPKALQSANPFSLPRWVNDR